MYSTEESKAYGFQGSGSARSCHQKWLYPAMQGTWDAEKNSRTVLSDFVHQEAESTGGQIQCTMSKKTESSAGDVRAAHGV